MKENDQQKKEMGPKEENQTEKGDSERQGDGVQKAQHNEDGQQKRIMAEQQ